MDFCIVSGVKAQLGSCGREQASSKRLDDVSANSID